MHTFIALELGGIAWLIRRLFGTKFAIRFIAVFPTRLFFKITQSSTTAHTQRLRGASTNMIYMDQSDIFVMNHGAEILREIVRIRRKGNITLITSPRKEAKK